MGVERLVMRRSATVFSNYRRLSAGQGRYCEAVQQLTIFHTVYVCTRFITQ